MAAGHVGRHQRKLLAASATAGLEARDHCQRLIHDDSVEFVVCIDALLRERPENTTTDRYAKLGISYYAWLATTAALKNGLPTAEDSARHFLATFRPMQQRLKVSDEALCATIPGDCDARIGRIHLMEAEVAAHPRSIRSSD